MKNGATILIIFYVFVSAYSIRGQGTNLDRQGFLLEPYLEWDIQNDSYIGNPFEVEASVTFLHESSGEQIKTNMFFAGKNIWKFRFTGTKNGKWSFVTKSPDLDLDGLSGNINIIPNDVERNGFFKNFGNKWGFSGSDKAFIPQLVMYAIPKYFYQNPNKIDSDIQKFIYEHGFNGFHVMGLCSWFDIEKLRSDEIGQPDPDFKTFEALELLITKTYKAGGIVHIWLWGDEQRKWTPKRWGLNSLVDKRLQRYIAARLGPLPGWSMGYGFDLDEWVTSEDVKEWYEYMHAHLGWSHYLGARDAGPNYYSPGVNFKQIFEGLDYASYEQFKPDYDAYRATINARPEKPAFSEDRFRIRGKYEKDYSMEEVRKGLWISTMAGGVANIWGNLSDGRDQLKGSLPFPNFEWIKTYSIFFSKSFYKDLKPNELISDGYALSSKSKNIIFIYKENTDKIQLNLSQYQQAAKILAVDVKKNYAEQNQGIFESVDQVWTAPYSSDWALRLLMLDDSSPNRPQKPKGLKINL